MNCIGCNKDVGDKPAAYAIMHERDFEALEVAPVRIGLAKFHAAPVCFDCFHTPSNRKRQLKAHFSLPDQLPRMVGNAGSSGAIGG